MGDTILEDRERVHAKVAGLEERIRVLEQFRSSSAALHEDFQKDLRNVVNVASKVCPEHPKDEVDPIAGLTEMSVDLVAMRDMDARLEEVVKGYLELESRMSDVNAKHDSYLGRICEAHEGISNSLKTIHLERRGSRSTRRHSRKNRQVGASNKHYSQ